MKQGGQVNADRLARLTSRIVSPEALKMEIIIAALMLYKQKHGNLLVPQKFLVPTVSNFLNNQDNNRDESQCDHHYWPFFCRGLKLGEEVNTIRRSKLYHSYRNRESFGEQSLKGKLDCNETLEINVQSLLQMSNIGTNKKCCGCGEHFPIVNGPNENNLLDSDSSGANSLCLFPDRVGRISRYYDRLERIGFIWNALDYTNDLVSRCMEIHERVYGHRSIPTRFIVPSPDPALLRGGTEPKGFPWPREAWGFKLGEFVYRRELKGICESRKRCSASQAQRSSSPFTERTESQFGTSYQSGYINGFTTENSTYPYPKEMRRERQFGLIVLALQAHLRLFGDLLVPRYFTVPADRDWPESTWGMQLGNRVRNIRAKTAYNQSRYHKQLEEMGFQMKLPGRRRGSVNSYD